MLLSGRRGSEIDYNEYVGKNNPLIYYFFIAKIKKKKITSNVQIHSWLTMCITDCAEQCNNVLRTYHKRVEKIET